MQARPHAAAHALPVDEQRGVRRVGVEAVPAVLSGLHTVGQLADGEHGFAALVRRCSGDVPLRAVLDELLRGGAAQRPAGGCIALCARACAPAQGEDEKLHILGTDVAYRVAPIDHNLQHGGSDARLQRKVMDRGIAPQALLERLGRWLAAQLDAQPSADPGSTQARAGLGICRFEPMPEPHEVSTGADR